MNQTSNLINFQWSKQETALCVFQLLISTFQKSRFRSERVHAVERNYLCSD